MPSPLFDLDALHRAHDLQEDSDLLTIETGPPGELYAAGARAHDDEEPPTIPMDAMGTLSEHEPQSAIVPKPQACVRPPVPPPGVDDMPTLVTPPTELKSLKEASRPSTAPTAPSPASLAAVHTLWPAGAGQGEVGNEDETHPFVHEQPEPAPPMMFEVPQGLLMPAPVASMPYLRRATPLPTATVGYHGGGVRFASVVTQSVAVVSLLLAFNTLGAWLARPAHRTPAYTPTASPAADLAASPPRRYKVESLTPAEYVAAPIVDSGNGSPKSPAAAEKQASRPRKPSKWDRAMAIGRAAMETGDYRRAARSFRRASQLRGSDATTHAMLGDALLRTLNTRGALRAYQRALEIDPNNVAARTGARRAVGIHRAR